MAACYSNEFKARIGKPLSNMRNDTLQTLSRRTSLIWLVAGLATLAGCAAIEEKKRTNLLADRVRAYTKAIRWGDFDLATRFLRRRDGESAQVDAGAIDGVRVTAYDHNIEAVGPAATEAMMVAKFDYQRASSATIREYKQTALWWYYTESQNWFLDDDLPKF